MGHPPSRIYCSFLPTRILLSTVILVFAVLTSASPLTVQVEIVLDGVKTGSIHADHADNVMTTVQYDGLTAIAFSELSYKPTVRLLARDLC